MVMRLVLAAIAVGLGANGCAHLGESTKATPMLTTVKAVNVDARNKTVDVEHNGKAFTIYDAVECNAGVFAATASARAAASARNVMPRLPQPGENFSVWLAPSRGVGGTVGGAAVTTLTYCGSGTIGCHYFCGSDNSFWMLCGRVWTQL